MRVIAPRLARFLPIILLALTLAGGPLLAGCSAAGPNGDGTRPTSAATSATSATTTNQSVGGSTAAEPVATAPNRIPVDTPSGPLRLFCTPRATLNPLLDGTASFASISRLVYDGLFAIDASGRPQAALAEPGSAAYAPDGLSLTLRVADNRPFHSGAVVSAADVAASFAFLRGPGALTPQAASMPDITGIIATDARTLTITLSRPQPDIAWQLTFPVLPAAALAAAASNPLAILPGTGPYRIAAYAAGKGLTLQAADDGNNRKATVRTVQVVELPSQHDALRAFERDGIDMVGLPPESYPSYALRNGLKLERYATDQYVFLSFRNAEGALLANAARLAFVQAASRAPAVLDGLEPMGIESAAVPIHPASPVWRAEAVGTAAYQSLYHPASSGSAASQGTSAGSGAALKYPATRQALVILAPADDSVRAALANRLQVVLRERGAAAEVSLLPADAYQSARNAGQYDILVAQATTTGSADPRWLLGPAPDPVVAGSETLPRNGLAGYPAASAAIERLFAGGTESAANSPDLAAALAEASRLGPFTGIGFRFAALASGSRVLGQPRPQARSLYEGIEELWLWST